MPGLAGRAVTNPVYRVLVLYLIAISPRIKSVVNKFRKRFLNIVINDKFGWHEQHRTLLTFLYLDNVQVHLIYIFFIGYLWNSESDCLLSHFNNKKHPHRFEGEKGKNKNERMMQSIRGLDCLKNIIAWFK